MTALPPPHNLARPRPHAQQGGVALIVVLVMLVVIGLVSASAMRRAASADLISNNARLESLAKQAAQAALRTCEGFVLADNSAALPIQAAPTGTAAHWQTFGNWTGTSPMAKRMSYNGLNADKQPQCIAERSPISNDIVIITSRGFSPDFSADSNGGTVSGAVVWLQVILSLDSSSGGGGG